MINHSEPLPSQPAERDDRRAEVEAIPRGEIMKTLAGEYVSRAYVDTLTADRDRLKARLEELEKALEPFAEMATPFMAGGELDNMDGSQCGAYSPAGSYANVSDFRAARQALKGDGHE